MHLNKEQILTLKVCRNKAKLVEDLRNAAQEAQEAIDGVKSPSMAGMPGGGGSSSGAQERAIAKRDGLDAQLKAAQEDYARFRKRAEEIITLLKSPIAQFAQGYYVCAMDVGEAAFMVGVSDRTGEKYIRKIEALIDETLSNCRS